MPLTMELIEGKYSIGYVNNLVHVDKDNQKVHALASVVLTFGW